MPIGQKNLVDLPSSDAKSDDAKDTKSRAKKPPPKLPSETDLKNRIRGILDRIIGAAEVRGDEELADTLREDRDIIANGLVSVTRPFRFLMTPLLIVLAIVEPFMAFNRIVRLMIERIMTRRAEHGRDPGTPDA